MQDRLIIATAIAGRIRRELQELTQVVERTQHNLATDYSAPWLTHDSGLIVYPGWSASAIAAIGPEQGLAWMLDNRQISRLNRAFPQSWLIGA